MMDVEWCPEIFSGNVAPRLVTLGYLRLRWIVTALWSGLTTGRHGGANIDVSRSCLHEQAQQRRK